MTVEELVRMAAGGDEDAFAELVRLYENKVYQLALRMCSRPEDAVDVAQEAFLSAWRGLPTFRGEAGFATWLYRLTSNVCIDFLRKEKRRRDISMTVSLEDEEEARQAQLPDERYSPQQALERSELRQAVRDGLNTLSPEHRQVLVLRELEGRSYGEIAALLGLEEGTVKSRIARGRLALRNYLVASGNFSPSVPSKV